MTKTEYFQLVFTLKTGVPAFRDHSNNCFHIANLCGFREHNELFYSLTIRFIADVRDIYELITFQTVELDAMYYQLMTNHQTIVLDPEQFFYIECDPAPYFKRNIS